MKQIFIGQYRKVIDYSGPGIDYYIKIIEKLNNNRFLIKASIKHEKEGVRCNTCPRYNFCRKDMHYGCRTRKYLKEHTKPVSKIEILLKRLDKIL